MLKTRKILSKIQKQIDHKNALVITGSRQVGKTSLMKLLYKPLPQKQKVWFDLENPLHQKFFEEVDYDDIYKKLVSRGLDAEKRKYVFIDEIQNFPDITKIIKYLIDHFKVKFIVTGSATFYLKALFPESLAGRKFVYHLSTLDFDEYLNFRGLREDFVSSGSPNVSKKSLEEYEEYDQEYADYMRYGGYPEVALTEDVDTKKIILDNIFKSLFEKDILRLADYRNVKEIRDLLMLLTRRIGSKLDVTRISSELGVTRRKVYSYLKFLQAIFVVELVPIYTKSIDRSVASGKKVYFCDSGLAQRLGQLSGGQILENTVSRQLKNYGKVTYYNKKRTRGEIDFIVDDKVAFEVKRKATKHDLSKLNKLADKIEIPERYVVSQDFCEDLDGIVYPQFL